MDKEQKKDFIKVYDFPSKESYVNVLSITLKNSRDSIFLERREVLSTVTLVEETKPDVEPTYFPITSSLI